MCASLSVLGQIACLAKLPVLNDDTMSVAAIPPIRLGMTAMHYGAPNDDNFYLARHRVCAIDIDLSC